MSVKIVLVAGQEFSVPATTDNEAIRAQLQSMGFADVATAQIQTGTKTLPDGTSAPTVEFVKKAGTKGLLDVLLHQPPMRLRPRGPTPQQAALLDRLRGGMSGHDLVQYAPAILAALDAAHACLHEEHPWWQARSSRPIDRVPAAPSPDTPPTW